MFPIQKPQLIHIVAELIILLGVCAYFQNRTKKLEIRIIESEKRISELEKILESYKEFIAKHENILNSLITGNLFSQEGNISQNVSNIPQTHVSPSQSPVSPSQSPVSPSQSPVSPSQSPVSQHQPSQSPLVQNTNSNFSTIRDFRNQPNLSTNQTNPSTIHNQPIKKKSNEKSSDESISDIEKSISEADLDKELEMEYNALENNEIKNID